jgi:SAM-dependent methyltransferase
VRGVPVLLPFDTEQLLELHAAYPDRFAVPAYVSGSSAHISQEGKKTQARFGYEWMRYPACFHDEERGIFIEETQLEPAEFAGRLTLDAGCGMGRFTRSAGAHGGEVVGVDLSESVYRAREITGHMPNVHIVQADLMQLPFRAGSFDIIYSLGVLHHTPDTHKAFASVARHVRPGGMLSIWVYGTAGRYADFASNPLRPERLRFVGAAWAKRLYWLLVLTREKCSDALRLITVRLPHRLLYACCYLLALLGAVPLIKYVTFSAHRDWRVRLLENFDWLSPPFQHHHNKEDVAAWFREGGFEEVRMLRHGFIPKVGILGRKLSNR